MTPHLKPKDRKDVIAMYKKRLDGDEPVSDAIIEKDREQLRKLLMGRKRK